MNDPSSRPGRLSFAAFVIALLLALLSYLIGYRWAESQLIMTTAAALFAVAIFSFIAWWHAYLVRREGIEEEDKSRLRREYDREDLFGDSDATLNLAKDAHKAFDKYFLTSFCVGMGLLLVLYVLLVWRSWSGPMALQQTVDRNALQAAGLSFFMLVFCLLAGNYFNGLSREKGCRFLRPCGAWFLFTGGIYAVAFLAMLAEQFGIGQWDRSLARAVLVVLAFFGLELIFNFIIEFYRPRAMGEEERPLYESKVLGLLTEPGGIAKNVAHSLDYQFGFKVSETWFYAFLEKAVVPFVIILALTLYLLDCFVLIDARELGIRETFGKPATEALAPGLRVKLPYPLQRIRIFPVGEAQNVSVGYVPYAKGETPAPNEEVPEEQMDTTGGEVIVWNKHHYKSETRFLVPALDSRRHVADDAATPPAAAQRESRGGTVPVSFLSANVYVQYRIDETDLMAYAYNYADPRKALEHLVWQEAVAYFASVNFIDLLAEDYDVASKVLGERVASAVERQRQAGRSLGVKVINVGLAGAHPPVEVAADFQAVVAEHVKARTKVLESETAAVKLDAEGIAEKHRLEQEAQAYYITKSNVAAEEAKRFESQLIGYRHAPRLYRLRAYLDMLEEASSGIRKYLVSSPSSSNIMIFDFVEKSRPDLESLDLNKPEY